jgi:hypothetical protein
MMWDLGLDHIRSNGEKNDKIASEHHPASWYQNIENARGLQNLGMSGHSVFNAGPITSGNHNHVRLQNLYGFPQGQL